MITHRPLEVSSTFFALGTGDFAGDFTGVFFETPPLGATAFALGVDFAGVAFFADEVLATDVLGLEEAALEGVARVGARVGEGGVALAAGLAGAGLAGVFASFGDLLLTPGICFAGDFAEVQPRNLSLRSLFDRFESSALNASSARIFAQAPDAGKSERERMNVND